MKSSVLGKGFTLSTTFIILSSTFATAAPSVRTNAIGYEAKGPKIAVAQDASAPGATSFELLDPSKTVVYTGKPGAAQAVPGWSDMQFQTLDFSSVSDTGLFTLRIQPSGVVSDTFRIGDARLFRTSAHAVVGFFKGMRNTSEDDHAIPYFGEKERGKHDVYGGWNDATGDQGKYISHLSFANFMNPQQIPMVTWSLLRSQEMAGSHASAIPFTEEALWGADYLLRILDKDGYFYINVFNEGWSGTRTICAWETSAGKSTGDYQAAWREGGGMSIAALALASRLSSHGDSSSAQYLAGAERGFAHLSAAKGKWADDGKENLIDHMTALLAATELFLATGKDSYRAAATARVDSILVRQQKDGWFYTDSGYRPWYHAVDEGLPVVALTRYLAIDSSTDKAAEVRHAIQSNLDWYKTITNEVANPFGYPRMWVPLVATTPSGASNLSKGRSGWASTVEKAGTEVALAFDGVANTRWASALQDSTGWLAVDLGADYRLDSVAVVWEAAYAKKYEIQISTDSVNWTAAATVTNSASGRRSTPLTARPSARYVRMKGLERSSSSYSYSIYEFEVYGRPDAPDTATKRGKTSFFMPHQNETGYWWQGENARIASMATSFILGMQAVDPQWRLNSTDTISRMAVSALDWITGSNPFGRSFLHGFGASNPPGYKGAENVVGGIANGITSSFDDETAPEFMHYADGADWQNWRWVEQWLPHDSWYLLGISAVAYSRERPIIVGVQPRTAEHRKLSITRRAAALEVSAPGATSIELRSLDGRILSRAQGASLSWNAPLSGLTLVVAIGEGWQQTRVVGSIR